MIGAVVILAAAVAVFAVVVGVLVLSHQRERERWTAERRALVDRAIARHSGEILAYDRSANRSPTNATADPDRPRNVLIEGLS